MSIFHPKWPRTSATLFLFLTVAVVIASCVLLDYLGLAKYVLPLSWGGVAVWLVVSSILGDLADRRQGRG